MDASEALRTARRRAGLSQRALAAAANLSPSAVGAYESGARSPTAAVLEQLLAVAGLESVPATRLDPPCGHLEPHLRLGLVQRLHIALGGTGNVRHTPPAAWTQLWTLAREQRVGVVGLAAVGIWVPPGRSRARAQVAIGDDRTSRLPPGLQETAPDLELVPAASTTLVASIPVVFRGKRVFVPSPGELALEPACRGWQTPLRAASRMLHADRTGDAAGRRAPAHRDPVHDREAYVVFHTKRYGQRPMPEDAHLRGWRLGGPVGYQDWLRWIGYPG